MGTGYRIERLSGIIWVELGGVTIDQTSFYDAAVMPGETYQYRIRAYRKEDNQYSPYSASASITIPQAVLQKIFLPLVLR